MPRSMPIMVPFRSSSSSASCSDDVTCRTQHIIVAANSHKTWRREVCILWIIISLPLFLLVSAECGQKKSTRTCKVAPSATHERKRKRYHLSVVSQDMTKGDVLWQVVVVRQSIEAFFLILVFEKGSYRRWLYYGHLPFLCTANNRE